MVELRKNNHASVSDPVHRCGPFCLGPLTFHSQVLGEKVSLSQNCRRAQRNESTFRNGLVFSSRPLKVQERIRLRMEKDSLRWQGALRVGFTNVPPSARSGPLPSMAMPDLSESPGHWVAPVHESYCRPGSVLELWVSFGGSVYVSSSNNNRKEKLLTGVDLREPLWAVVDIYGQTSSIFLLGSEKKALLTHRSCPGPPSLSSSEEDQVHSWISEMSSLCGDTDGRVSDSEDKHCVVCMERGSRITLPCGHRCLCSQCTPKVIQQFGTCPLCRHQIRAVC